MSLKRATMCHRVLLHRKSMQCKYSVMLSIRVYAFTWPTRVKVIRLFWDIIRLSLNDFLNNGWKAASQKRLLIGLKRLQ